jgi:hypothetical protein
MLRFTNQEDPLRDAKYCPMLCRQIDHANLPPIGSLRSYCIELGRQRLAERVAAVDATDGFATPPAASYVFADNATRAAAAGLARLAHGRV